eukprot:Rmarinus@m.14094
MKSLFIVILSLSYLCGVFAVNISPVFISSLLGMFADLPNPRELESYRTHLCAQFEDQPQIPDYSLSSFLTNACNGSRPAIHLHDIVELAQATFSTTKPPLLEDRLLHYLNKLLAHQSLPPPSHVESAPSSAAVLQTHTLCERAGGTLGGTLYEVCEGGVHRGPFGRELSSFSFADFNAGNGAGMLLIQSSALRWTQPPVTYDPSRSKVAVLVETRVNTLLEPTIRNVMHYLGDGWNLHVFCGAGQFGSCRFVQNTFQDWRFRLTPLMDVNMTRDSYSAMLKSVDFWQTVREEHVLLFQTDSMLFRHGILEFLSYDFVGASVLNKYAITPQGGGWNGGLSLRRRSSQLRAVLEVTLADINDYRLHTGIIPFPDVFLRELVEDLFFAHALEILQLRDVLRCHGRPREGDCREIVLPPHEVARMFSVESCLSHPRSLGMHKYLAGCVISWDDGREEFFISKNLVPADPELVEIYTRSDADSVVMQATNRPES